MLLLGEGPDPFLMICTTLGTGRQFPCDSYRRLTPDDRRVTSLAMESVGGSFGFACSRISMGSGELGVSSWFRNFASRYKSALVLLPEGYRGDTPLPAEHKKEILSFCMRRRVEGNSYPSSQI